MFLFCLLLAVKLAVCDRSLYTRVDALMQRQSLGGQEGAEV